MAASKRPSFLKRQKEQTRLARAAEKREARLARRQNKANAANSGDTGLSDDELADAQDLLGDLGGDDDENPA